MHPIAADIATSTPLTVSARTPGGGIDPKIWGPHAWAFMKYIMQGFDPESQDPSALCRWVNCLPDVLPCQKCRVNFKHTLEKYPFKPYCERNMCQQWLSTVREEVRKHESKSPRGTQRQVVADSRKFSARPWLLGLAALGVGFGLGYWAHRLYQQHQQQQRQRRGDL